MEGCSASQGNSKHLTTEACIFGSFQQKWVFFTSCVPDSYVQHRLLALGTPWEVLFCWRELWHVAEPCVPDWLQPAPS